LPDITLCSLRAASLETLETLETRLSLESLLTSHSLQPIVSLETLRAGVAIRSECHDDGLTIRPRRIATVVPDVGNVNLVPGTVVGHASHTTQPDIGRVVLLENPDVSTCDETVPEGILIDAVGIRVATKDGGHVRTCRVVQPDIPRSGVGLSHRGVEIPKGGVTAEKADVPLRTLITAQPLEALESLKSPVPNRTLGALKALHSDL
jgi:hypothetical protein